MERMLAKNLADARAYIEHKAGALKRPNGRYLRRQEIRLQNRLVRRWQVQMNYVIDKMAGFSAFQEAKGVRRLEHKTIEQDANDLVNDLPGNTELVEELVITARPTYKKGAVQAIGDLEMAKFGIDFSLVNTEAIQYLEALRTLHLSDFRGSITRQTKDRIKRILIESAEKGRSYSETAKIIRDQGDAGVFSRARGELIAVNQVGRAYGEGNMEIVDKFIARTGTTVQKYWQTIEDDRVTPECAANEAEGWIGFNTAFSSGDENAPRESNPRCRCVTAFRVVDMQGNEI